MLHRVSRFLLVCALFAVSAAPAMAAEASIPAGTVITQSNWQQYKQFMSVTLQHMFMSTSPTTNVPPGAKIVVGPTQHYAIGNAFWNATEKYAKQVKLVRASTGSYGLSGYVAGEPFPNVSPSDPLAGYKIMYNLYYYYNPAIIVYDRSQVMDIDRYGNVSKLHALLVDYLLMHITDPGYPMRIAGFQGIYQTKVAEQTDPEQIKYVTALNITFDDPNHFPESYVFLPSLRRAIRLSSAARCAPFQGQDFNNDDETNVPLPPVWFQAKLVGLKPMLMFIYRPDHKTLAASAQRSSYYPGGANLFPKPEVLGPWQMRDLYVVQIQRLPQFQSGYCYAKRLNYLDKEAVTSVGYDTWDQNGKVWRGMVPLEAPLQKPDGSYYLTATSWAHDNPDFQNSHQSLLMPPAAGPDAVYLDQKVPSAYVNYQRYATPAGLQEIMQ
jgi:hypothetical protein